MVKVAVLLTILIVQYLCPLESELHKSTKQIEHKQMNTLQHFSIEAKGVFDLAPL